MRMKRKGDCITSNIRWLMDQYGCSHLQLAEALGVARNTLTNRFAAPETFTVGEIRRVASFFHVDVCSIIDGKLC